METVSLNFSKEELERLDVCQLHSLLTSLNDILFQNAYEGREFVEDMTNLQSEFLFIMGKKLGYY